MKAIYLDTHVVLWLYMGEASKFSQPVVAMLESHDLFISPMVALEMQYLVEIGRVNVNPSIMLEDLQSRIGLIIDDLPFYSIVKKAIDIQWTRDPFDRMIVANALGRDLSLITKDQTILTNFKQAIW